MSHSPELKVELSRELNLFHLTMMGLGMMIGAGVFLGIGNSIGKVGPGGLILTFALNTLLAIFTAMSYAELSSAIPRAGGAYNFARLGFGRGTSFVSGWMEWFASSVAGSLYAVTFSIYVVEFLSMAGFLGWLPEAYHLIFEKLITAGIALFFIFINYRGASETGKIGAFMTLGQTLFLVVIAIIGAIVVIQDPSRMENFDPFMPRGWMALLVTLGFTSVAFEGYEVIAQAGDEAINPKKNLPKAMLLSVFIVGLVYIAVSFTSVISVKASDPDVSGPVWQWIGSFKEIGFKQSISKLFPSPWGNYLVTLAVVFASTSALNATVYSAARASYALGRDRMLPKIFAKISQKRKTPSMAIFFTAIIVLAVALFFKTEDVASSASIMFLFLFLMVNLSVIRIRLNLGDELKYGFIMPLFPLFPILAIGAQIVLAISLNHVSLVAWIIAPLWIGAGILIYRFYSKKRALPSEDEVTIIEEEEAPKGDEYRVMVPIANPRNALSLVYNTRKLGSKQDSRIKLLHMVQVPDQMALSDADQYILEGKEAIVEAMLYLMPRFPVTTTIRHCRNVARGIVSAVREKRISLLILGWHGQKTDVRFQMGSTLDHVISRSPCDIVILKDTGNKKFAKVLVLFWSTGGDDFALETASLMCAKKGHITVLNVKGNNGPKPVFDKMEGREDIQFSSECLEGAHPLNCLLKKSRDFDLVVTVIPEKKPFTSLRHQSLMEQFTHDCQQPMALVKESKGISSFTKKWF